MGSEKISLDGDDYTPIRNESILVMNGARLVLCVFSISIEFAPFFRFTQIAIGRAYVSSSFTRNRCFLQDILFLGTGKELMICILCSTL